MSEEIARIHQPAAEISEEALKRAEELIEQEEGVQNKFRGRLADFITAVAVLMSLFHLYAAYPIVRTEALRAIHVAFDVSSSLIILFTVYGAFLQHSGAGKFYIDFSFSAMGGKPTGAGRTVVLASFLLGGPSGSGVATTVTLGSVAYPMLTKVGYGKDTAGGLLSD